MLALLLLCVRALCACAGVQSAAARRSHSRRCFRGARRTEHDERGQGLAERDRGAVQAQVSWAWLGLAGLGLAWLGAVDR